MTLRFDLEAHFGPRFFPDLIDAVLSAGCEARAIAERGFTTEFKADRSPVTEADQRVESRIRAFLSEHAKNAAIFGEEEGMSGDESTGLVFHVDPIDGTRAFLRGLPSWSILIGLEKDRVPVFGLAYFPADDDLYTAALGHGAYRNGRPLRVSKVEKLEHAAISHGGLQQFTEWGDFGILERLANHTFTARGYADFDGYRQLLLGRVDAMIDPCVKSYDICAAAILIREAGGRFTDLRGVESIHEGSGLATSGPIHDEILRVIRGE